MTTSTFTYTVTRTHTATHLCNAILGALAEILSHLGLSANSLAANWDDQYRPAIQTWINEGSLDQVVLECHRLDGRVEPIFEFPIEYTYDGTAELSHRHTALARLWSKLNRVPAGTQWTIFCQFHGSRTPMEGWVSGFRSSTEDLRSFTLGTLAGGPHAAASIRAYTN